MSKRTMQSMNWEELLETNGELLAIMPTELRTPWLCHIAFQRSEKPLCPYEDGEYVPEHLRDAVSRLYNWENEEDMEEDEDEYHNEYGWDDKPYERPFNETGEINVSNGCIVCDGTPDGTISKNYYAINGLQCCNKCYEEHFKHRTRHIMWSRPYLTSEDELVYWNSTKNEDMTTLVIPNTETVYTRHDFGIPPYDQWCPEILSPRLAYDIQNYKKEPILRIRTAMPVAA